MVARFYCIERGLAVRIEVIVSNCKLFAQREIYGCS